MKDKILGLVRIALGWLFLWAFFDKLFGWGFATKVGSAWINGGSPTSGFLLHATKGPFVDFFHSLANQGWVDSLFMFGLLGIGVSMIFGVATRLGGISGFLMVMLMFIAESIPPVNNPVIEEHVVYALLFLFFALQNPFEQKYSLAGWWSRTRIAQKLPFLR